MPVDVYYSEISPPSRAVLLAAKAVGVEINKIHLNLFEGEHMKPEFAEMNPQQVVPTINDEGFILWESGAIMGYLVDAYAEDDGLYPKDPKQRAVVNQRLLFMTGSLAPAFTSNIAPVLFKNETEIPEENKKRLNKSLGLLDGFIKDHGWVAGDLMTIADFAIVAGVSTLEAGGYDLSPYENVSSWLEKCKETMEDFEGCCLNGACMFGEKIKSKFEEAGVSF